jgi:hypothetical protein
MPSEIYIVRISPSKKIVVEDYKEMKKEIEIYSRGLWDKDHDNKMKVGDLLLFIIGEKNEELVEYFKIEKELSSLKSRHTHWKSDDSYTSNCKESVKHRKVIRLVSINYPSTPWIDFKISLGYTHIKYNSWMPRGTMRIVNKHKLEINRNLINF